jgi:glucose-6-phosphate 1-epimerase
MDAATTGIIMAEFGQLPAVRITAADGAQATVTLFGAHLVSWKTADGTERLFVSAKSALDGSRPIRGGVPLIFPQFNERGPGLRHGFARVSTWRLADSGREGPTAFAVFELLPADVPAALAHAWPHPFALRLRVALRGAELRLEFEVRNSGADALQFAAALHTYHRVSSIGAVRIGGVRRETLRVDGKLDHIFFGIPDAIALDTGAARLRLAQTGFRDAVVWNPGAADAAAIADMEDEDYRRFVCIEPAAIEPQVVLEAGRTWRGTHTVTAE